MYFKMLLKTRKHILISGILMKKHCILIEIKKNMPRFSVFISEFRSTEIEMLAVVKWTRLENKKKTEM